LAIEVLGDDFGGDGGQEDAVAVVTGGQGEILPGARAEDGACVGREGSVAPPGFHQGPVGEGGVGTNGCLEEGVDAPGGDSPLKSHVFAGGTYDQSAIVTGNQVGAGKYDVVEARSVGSLEGQHLAFAGVNGQG